MRCVCLDDDDYEECGGECTLYGSCDCTACHGEKV
jgi:hypothetical protein